MIDEQVCILCLEVINGLSLILSRFFLLNFLYTVFLVPTDSFLNTRTFVFNWVNCLTWFNGSHAALRNVGNTYLYHNLVNFFPSMSILFDVNILQKTFCLNFLAYITVSNKQNTNFNHLHLLNCLRFSLFQHKFFQTVNDVQEFMLVLFMFFNLSMKWLENIEIWGKEEKWLGDCW